MSEKEIIESEVFIGARALNKDQVKLILPTYDSLQLQIEEIRKSAKLNKKEAYKQYNNTISIFGKRGTGKTSILFTIIEGLSKEKEKNIILPKIEPDTYSDTTKILGAILRFLKDELDKINEEISKLGNCKDLEGFFKNCKFNSNNKLTIAYNELLEYYCYMNEEYRDILIKNYSNMRSYTEKYSYILAPDHEFNKKFNGFIDELVDVRKNLNKKEDNQEEPLVFIIIDDIDLKTTKCKELIDTVLSCICNKNIVCFLSGDEEILNEAITLSLLDKENMANNNTYFFDNPIFDVNMLNRKKLLTYDYLKKALPPAFRHSVVNWNLINIPKFSFDKRTNIEVLGEKLHENFRGDIEEDISIFKNPLVCGEDGSDNYTFIPYYVFDQTPRGLINIFYYLNKYKMIKEFDDFSIKKGFIDTIISSTNKLSKHKEEIYNKYLLWSDSEKNTVINFLALYNNYINKSKKDIEETKEEKIKQKNKQKNTEGVIRKKTKKKYLRIFLLLIIAKEVLKNPEIIESESNIEIENNEKLCFYEIYQQNISDNTIEFSTENTLVKNIKKDYIVELLKYSDFKFSLLLFENLKSENDEEIVFIKICKLIDKFKTNKYLKLWISDREKYKNINEFINNKIITNNIHKEIKKNLFDFEYKLDIKQSKEEKDAEQLIKLEEEKEIYELKNSAFYNYIIINEEHFQRLDTVNKSKLSETLDKYQLLRKENKNENKLKNLEEMIGKDLSKFLYEKLNEITEVKLEDSENKIINEYISNSQKKKNTLFGEAGVKAYELMNGSINLYDYRKIYKQIKRLSNNRRAWYGVYESLNLLEFLNSNIVVEINPKNEELDSVISKIIQCINLKNKESEFEKCKVKVKKEMDNIYREIRVEDEEFYKQVDYELEEIENSYREEIEGNKNNESQN